jgi:hypothetical protein
VEKSFSQNMYLSEPAPGRHFENVSAVAWLNMCILSMLDPRALASGSEPPHGSAAGMRTHGVITGVWSTRTVSLTSG